MSNEVFNAVNKAFRETYERIYTPGNHFAAQNAALTAVIELITSSTRPTVDKPRVFHLAGSLDIAAKVCANKHLHSAAASCRDGAEFLRTLLK